MVIVYQKDFGQRLDRRDRFDGNPTWMQTVIREYELGPLGPRHECETCDCITCGRYRWFRRAICACELSLRWGRTTGLEEAMRLKWLRCNCAPDYGFFSNDNCCKCILEMTTQECEDTPVSSYSLPSEFDGSDADRSDSPRQFIIPSRGEIRRILNVADEGEIRLLSGEDSWGRTELLIKVGSTEPLPTDSMDAVRLGENRNKSEEIDIDDTASSASHPGKRHRIS
ncbi:hypothetical protein KC19_4G030300 [Ceratodon purpureus]|uniref:Uncharacterized protein n=1 Tax=Ceratodon purpureus TaxID=3225 RepID=A0A8T0I4N1_CERPU|nr:hypothetical protein KC19_4G030300 [Ceratodon purpureus]